jgi:hypothetical protein
VKTPAITAANTVAMAPMVAGFLPGRSLDLLLLAESDAVSSCSDIAITPSLHCNRSLPAHHGLGRQQRRSRWPSPENVTLLGGRTMAIDTPRWRSHTPIMAPRCRDQWGRHYDAKHPTVPAARQRGAGKGRSGVFGGFGRSRPRPRARCPTRQPPHVSTLRPRALGAACAGHPGADAFDNLVCLVLVNGAATTYGRVRESGVVSPEAGN